MFALYTPLSLVIYGCFLGIVIICLVRSVCSREKQKSALFALALVWILGIGVHNLYMFRDLSFEEIQSKGMSENLRNEVVYIELNDKLLSERDSENLMAFVSDLTFNRAFNKESDYLSKGESQPHHTIRMLDEKYDYMLLMVVCEDYLFGSWKEKVLFFGDIMSPLWVTRSDGEQTFYQMLEDLNDRNGYELVFMR